MPQKERKRISYVLPLAKSAGGHRLGVNGLAVDDSNSILYSGGRDGVVCAWDLHLSLDSAAPVSSGNGTVEQSRDTMHATTFRQQVQAHTHWINDIALADSGRALVSASSDLTVRVWTPLSEVPQPAQTIGLHRDYVKRLAVPARNASWIASGGLDRKICIWDLNGGGVSLSIGVGEDDSDYRNKEKGSIYALAATSNLLASGGPENVVRVWDNRIGRQITKLVGHTDTVRDILISDDGDTIMSASSDQTIKIWSLTAGRCMYTLTMHADSVWCLYSRHPQLSIFYSSDRGGLVAKTDTSCVAESDHGMSIAIAQENEGVNTIVQAGEHIWTSTSSSSITRWQDVDTDEASQSFESLHSRTHRLSIATTKTKISVGHTEANPQPSSSLAVGGIPIQAFLRVSNASPLPFSPFHDPEAVTLSSRRGPELIQSHNVRSFAPIRTTAEHLIEGQNGLIKHVLLNDRRRVLTLDTAGEVVLWDLLQCRAIETFGKKSMEDVMAQINTMESVAHWCTVDTRTGSLTCVLEENYCFDAEMYADELDIDEQIDFREDQRINLGKWVLRYLFANLIDEEIRRDELFRKDLGSYKISEVSQKPNLGRLQMPPRTLPTWPENSTTPVAATSHTGNTGWRPLTPSLGIGLATPAVLTPPANQPRTSTDAARSPGAAEQSVNSPPPGNGGDYFSSVPLAPMAQDGGTTDNGDQSETTSEQRELDLNGPATETKKKATPFGKKFRMDMSFGKKKPTRDSSAEEKKDTLPAEAEVEKSEDSDGHSSTTDKPKSFEDNFLGYVQRLRQEYQQFALEALRKDPPDLDAVQSLASAVAPSLPAETPVLKPPGQTIVLIQQDDPGSGGVADLFEGTVASLAAQADTVERVAPQWLAELLLRNQIPTKDITKVAFVLEPYPGSDLPPIASGGNNRLNANRMLRARKVMSYVAERLETQPSEKAEGTLAPESYIKLHCQNQRIPPTMTLATIRAHVWKGGGDVLLHYSFVADSSVRL